MVWIVVYVPKQEMKHPGWAIFVSIAFATLVFFATLTRIIMWWSRKTADKYVEEWDKIMARCGRGETIGELLSTSEQVLRAECTCHDTGKPSTLKKRLRGSQISFEA